ncbi:AraC family transcriptional regulator [Paenibacillus sp. IB182493]|uniref:AraC family transcriptional regulator n=2 Tax=Paenibacillus arenilitoris TaxID=2772299 RepID=A0A927H5I6_9BACL|nr:AraC family transcriptional regulator [Paenibacillus arenilitoris]
MDAGLLRTPEARIVQDDFERIVVAAARYTGDEMFGLHQSQRLSLSDLGVLGYVMLHSKTLGKALSAYQKYNFIDCSGFNINVEVQGEDVVISIFLGNSPEAPGRHFIECMTASFYRTLLALSCRPLPVKAISFMHAPPSQIEEYEAVFGMMPLFHQQVNSLRLSKEILDYSIIGSDTRLFNVFQAMAEEVRAKLASSYSELTSNLNKWIIECMPSHFPNLQEAAKEFLMSPRTLQSRLKAENTSYNRLANEVRKELAIRYLAQTEYTIGEIAYLLHFSEPSAFQTAFRKWTNLTPGEYRQREREEVSPGEGLRRGMSVDFALR